MAPMSWRPGDEKNTVLFLEHWLKRVLEHEFIQQHKGSILTSGSVTLGFLRGAEFYITLKLFKQK